MTTKAAPRWRVLAFVIAAVGFLAVPLSLSAQFVPDGKWWKRPRIAAAIGLTQDQEKQLDQIFVRTRPKLIDLKAEVEKREFDFQTAMEDGATVDRTVIAARIQAREEARAKLQKELVLMVLDMKQVLNKEQWDRLTKMQQQMRERRREMKEDERGLGLEPPPPNDQRQQSPPPGNAPRRPAAGAPPSAGAPARPPGR